MGKYAVVKSSETKESITLVFSGGTLEEIADKTALFLAARGYHLESGTKSSRRGCEKLMSVAVVIAKAMTGMSGGFLGMAQMGKELGSLSAGLQSAILS